MHHDHWTKEADLNTAILFYAHRCVAEGDYKRLATLGFEPQDVRSLRQLTLSSLQHLAGIKGHMLKARVD